MARRSSPQVTDSYYTVIRGKKYDRRMLELAAGLTKGRGDGRISINDAKNLLRVVKDSNNYSAIEKATMEYIRKRYKFTKEGDELFRAEIRKWAAGKGKKKGASRSEKKSTGAELTYADMVVPTSQTTAGGPVRKTSAPKEIFLGIVLLALFTAIFYFIAYKSNCSAVKRSEAEPAADAKPAPTIVPTSKPAEPAQATQRPAPQPSAELGAFVRGLKVTFIAEKAEIGPTGNARLDALASRLKNENARILVTGHTCSLGSRELNQKISEKRAQVVKDALISRGVKAENIDTQGVAATEPVGDNKTVAGRVANRRVTFKIVP